MFSGTITGLTNGDNVTATYSCSAVSISPPGIVPDSCRRWWIRTAGWAITPLPLPTARSRSRPDRRPPSPAHSRPGLTNGGTAVTLTGSGFELGAGVPFGRQPATSVTVNSSGTQITAITPTGPLGLVNVAMTNPDSTTATLTNGFTYTGPPPTIVTQPANLTVPKAAPRSSRSAPLYAGTYQWQMNGGNLVDNGRITGSHGNALTIPGAQLYGRGQLPGHDHQCLWLDHQRGGRR